MVDLILEEKEQINQELWALECRFCSSESRFVASSKIESGWLPAGWEESPVYGVRCQECVRVGRIQ